MSYCEGKINKCDKNIFIYDEIIEYLINHGSKTITELKDQTREENNVDLSLEDQLEEAIRKGNQVRVRCLFEG